MYFELQLLPGGRKTYVQCREYKSNLQSSLYITVLSFFFVQSLFARHEANCLLIIFFASKGFFLAIRPYKSF